MGEEGGGEEERGRRHLVEGEGEGEVEGEVEGEGKVERRRRSGRWSTRWRGRGEKEEEEQWEETPRYRSIRGGLLVMVKGRRWEVRGNEEEKGGRGGSEAKD